MARKKQIAELKAKDEPTVVVGSHLTVITHPDGKTELLWDDEALLNEVRAAILKAESNIPASVESKTKSRKKKV